MIFPQIIHRFIGMIILSGTLMSQPLTVESVKDSLLARFHQINDYTVQVKISVDMVGFRMPRKKVKLYYKSPDKVKVESRGFAIVPKTGLGGSPTPFLNMLSFISIDVDNKTNNYSEIKLLGNVIPDSLHIPMSDLSEIPDITMSISIDTTHWIIKNVSTSIDHNTFFDINSEYSKVDNYYLPSKTVMTLGLAGLEDWSLNDPIQGHGKRRQKKGFEEMAKELDIELNEDGTAGTITMEFSKYKINRGLKDRLFEETDW